MAAFAGARRLLGVRRGECGPLEQLYLVGIWKKIHHDLVRRSQLHHDLVIRKNLHHGRLSALVNSSHCFKLSHCEVRFADLRGLIFSHWPTSNCHRHLFPVTMKLRSLTLSSRLLPSCGSDSSELGPELRSVIAAWLIVNGCQGWVLVREGTYSSRHHPEANAVSSPFQVLQSSRALSPIEGSSSPLLPRLRRLGPVSPLISALPLRARLLRVHHPLAESSLCL